MKRKNTRKQFKIAVVISSHIPSEWAHSINTAKHAQGFFNLGHDVTIIAPERYYENKLKKKIKSVHDFYNINKKIKIKFVKDRSPFYYKEVPIIKILFKIAGILTANTIFNFRDPEKEMADYIKKEDFDFAYCRAFRTPLFLDNLEIPFVVETHTPYVINPDQKRLLDRAHSNNFRGISTISDIIKKRLIEYGVPKEKILVQEDAVDIEKFNKIADNQKKIRQSLDLPTDKKIITYCGSLRQGKGIGDLLKTAERLQNNKDVLFLIVGGPEKFREQYEKERVENNINNTILTGFVNNKLVPKYLKASDILIMLYNTKEKGSVMDLKTTSPIKLFEYMSSKVPIVTSNIPTIAKIVKQREDAMLSKINSIGSAVQNIKTLLKSKSLRTKLSRNAYKKAENHTYTKRCKNIIVSLAEKLKR